MFQSINIWPPYRDMFTINISHTSISPIHKYHPLHASIDNVTLFTSVLIPITQVLVFGVDFVTTFQCYIVKEICGGSSPFTQADVHLCYIMCYASCLEWQLFPC